MSEKKMRKLKTRGERIYKKLLRRLLSKYKGQIVAIEPETGRYFVGRDELKVALKAMKAFPGKIFSVFRVGYPAVHKFRKFS
ncbi:MAG: hypothetical protein A2W61_03935 [Deltaproteobacteria bacterium RIFCSPLOWO2_01_44_7]|nr:MAG: hypothetical protein A2712_07605 [Deltaproteobacteria bacterium RIFCSPHIGHO2_01_FULL_43_49]OGQ14792.1 MAG: hypothetical protein A3D22_09390 [Deltaproteobacteria bacterium RIFCSPHIGHO2_02_FULL_44_53]OGQ28178.1 MAG: hypothetical protein A3D98_08100 [Deltaproteobacteria bacterium RIFCSPHIGHO2_12_FULL_44_21]OGQ31390.1 MAG: hypothetical protein A2979_08150 [Deltaproteobacteria bacterium RIFCSPLOWO2_01_FULL_45_74]OGQ39597.1 MAG: hypothetical protein A2W61_03935 [Deltaproteobacteria bacterium 